MIAVEAFSVAADPKRFVEQLQYVQPWQAKRILWNGFSNNAASSEPFKIDVGGFNPVLGKSYGEIAADSRSQHKSQGFGVARTRGEAFEFFRTLGGDAPANDLHDGIKTSWSKIGGGADLLAIQALVNKLSAEFDFLAPQKTLPGLIQLYKLLQSASMSRNLWAVQKQKEVKDLLVAASGLWLEAFTNVPLVAQGDSLVVNLVLNNRLGQKIKLKGIQGGALRMNEIGASFDSALVSNRNFIFTKRILIDAETPITQPYWLQEKMSDGYYNVKRQELIGTPDIQPAATLDISLSIEGADIVLRRVPVRYKFTDPVK
jgi:hypothetical protein